MALTGNNANQRNEDEHDKTIVAKKVVPYGYDANTGQAFRVGNPAGGIVSDYYDFLSLTEDTTTDVWTYKAGGSGGTTVATVTITYTDSNKGTISTVVRT